MCESTLVDCFIRGAMVGAGMLAFGGLCWVMERQGRKRWSAEKRRDAPYAGHVPPRPIPHSFDAMTAGWLAFSDETRQAYGSFEWYAQHLRDDPSRSLDNPVPQPTRGR